MRADACARRTMPKACRCHGDGEARAGMGQIPTGRESRFSGLGFHDLFGDVNCQATDSKSSGD